MSTDKTPKNEKPNPLASSLFLLLSIAAGGLVPTTSPLLNNKPPTSVAVQTAASNPIESYIQFEVKAKEFSGQTYLPIQFSLRYVLNDRNGVDIGIELSSFDESINVIGNNLSVEFGKQFVVFFISSLVLVRVVSKRIKKHQHNQEAIKEAESSFLQKIEALFADDTINFQNEKFIWVKNKQGQTIQETRQVIDNIRKEMIPFLTEYQDKVDDDLLEAFNNLFDEIGKPEYDILKIKMVIEKIHLAAKKNNLLDDTDDKLFEQLVAVFEKIFSK